MYLCIYITARSHTIYLDLLQTVFENNLRVTWRSQSSGLRDTLGGGYPVTLEMHLEAVIKRVSRCTWMPRLCNVGSLDWASVEMHLQAKIEWSQWRTWRPYSSKFADALGGYNWGRLGINSEAILKQTCRLWSSGIGDALGSHDRARMEEYLEAVTGRGTRRWETINGLVKS